MPYTPLPAGDTNDPFGSAESRWRAVLDARPDLAPAIVLQRRLLTIVAEVAQTLDGGSTPRLSLPPRYLAAKLARGVPALAGEPIPVPAVVLKPALLRLCEQLSAGGAGEAA